VWPMEDSLLNRYARQIRLSQVGVEGQRRLLDARVLIIGAGGLGSPVSMYLAAAGVGQIALSDFDHVDESNLARQIVHSQANLGQSKASSAKQTLEALNPGVLVDAFDYELDGSELEEQVRAADVVADCTDNFPSRFTLNRVSQATGTPLVTGAAIRWEGQVATFVPADTHGPCYQCLYPDEGIETVTCEAEGIMAPVVGIIGSIQALEVINLLLEVGTGLRGRVLLLDGLAFACHTIELPKNKNCPVCSSSA
jgi:molybdopterin/thiamine biosynthesis adenylyltransferase